MSRLLITRLNRLSLLSTRLTASTLTKPSSPILKTLPLVTPSHLFHTTPTPHKSDTMGSVGTAAPVRGLPEFSLQGKVIVVSGGGRGLGLTQAEGLLEAGAIVHVIDRLEKPSEDFDRVAARAKAELDTSITYHRADVREQTTLNTLVEDIANKHGRIDGLLAAAGIQQETPALDYTAEDCDRMLGVNVTGVFMTAQAVARQMIRLECTGAMVLIASMSGTVANRGLICPAYNASKAAVIQLARNLASEWGQHGIRVNTISPGYIETAMTAGLFETYPERRTDWPKANMLNRISKPEEYRGSAVFLLSDASSFMTGADLRIDGGHCAW
ncbi:short-chain dehydrogenase [Plectosphaerella plurivora]|uniref:Short-chain dehydrogenase n=1 Tax=Plectosphaerella plurivora TaxID=936078 RepID=A0A9P8V0E0_9PEZI|nr:short-chain dehydrogenase [Plectosphaerella plurivora]